jgi:hypothetical protein
LIDPSYDIEIKIGAIVALGNLCLSGGDHFLRYLDSSLENIISAEQFCKEDDKRGDEDQ